MYIAYIFYMPMYVATFDYKSYMGPFFDRTIKAIQGTLYGNRANISAFNDLTLTCKPNT